MVVEVDEVVVVVVVLLVVLLVVVVVEVVVVVGGFSVNASSGVRNFLFLAAWNRGCLSPRLRGTSWKYKKD